MEEEERGQMIDQNPKAGSSTLFVRGTMDKEFQFLGRRSPWEDMLTWCQTNFRVPNQWKEMVVFRTEVAVRGRADLMPKNSGQAHPWNELSFGTAVVVTRCIEIAAKKKKTKKKKQEKKRNRVLGQEITDAFKARSTESR